MKQILYIILILSLCSCEDVVDISLNESEPKLVIDASLNWVKGTSGNHQEIYLSLTRPFFSDEPTPVNGATVQISNTSGTVFGFSQNETLGTYETDDFEPMLNETYLLQIVFENELYVAETQLIPVIPIDFVEQTDNGGINGEDFEIKPNYSDPEETENFYFFSFETNITDFPILEVYEDEFTNGNQVFAYYTEEDLQVGDTVTIKSYGINERFYNFMSLLLTQTNSELGGPFETQPATLRGNIINQTTSSNFPLGFFRASEIDEVEYIIQ